MLLKNMQWKWLSNVPLIMATAIAIVFINVKFTTIAEFVIYSLIAGTLFLFLFYRNPYYCLYFFIIWLPLQTFVLSGMAASAIFSERLIVFLSSLKELALAMLFIILLKKRMFLRGKFSAVDYLFLLNIVIIVAYALLPDSVFGVSGGLKGRLFGLRSALVTLIIFLSGRFVPYDTVSVTKAIRLLCGVCVMVVLFGLVEFLFIPRQTLISGLIHYSVLKGEILENLLKADLDYVVQFGGVTIKRMMSFFLSPLGLAYFFIFPFGVITSATHVHEAKGRRLLPSPLVLLGFFSLAILLSTTRAVIVASVFMVVIVYSGRHIYKAFLLLGLFVLIVALSPIKSVFIDTINFEDTSSQAHAVAYLIGFENVINHPFGLGLGQAGPTANLIKEMEGMQDTNSEFTAGESLYLSMAVERGLPGVGVFIIFVSTIAWAGKKLAKTSFDGVSSILGKAVFVSTIGFMIASIPTEVWLGFRPSGIYWWFAGIVVQLYSNNKYLRSHLIRKGNYVQ